ALVRGVLDEVLTASTLTNPVTVHNMVSDFSPYMSVDSQLGESDYVADLAWSMRDVRGGDIDMFTIDNLGLGTAGSQSIVVPDYEAFTDAGEAMREGTFDEYAAAQ
ncbi:MAG: LCP family protein, partial [Nesterenkonia sp.]